MTRSGACIVFFASSLLTVLAATPAAAQAPDRKAIFDEFHRAVVQIKVVGRDREGRAKQTRGTGVLVSEYWVVTAKHVIGSDDEWYRDGGIGSPQRRIEVLAADENGRRAPIASEAFARLSATDDVAALRLPSRARACAPLGSISFVDEPQTFVGLFWARDTQVPDTRSVDTLTRDASVGDRALLAYKAQAGDSGSPLFDSSGTVVGFLTSQGPDRDDTSLALPAYTAVGLLPPDARCTRRPSSQAGAPTTPTEPQAVPQGWHPLAAEQAQGIVAAANASTVASYPETFVVSGERSWTESALIAKRITFEPGARLVFKGEATKVGRDILVVAEEIRSISRENPGVIAWDPPPLPSPAAAGTARSGAPGSVDGAPGGRGEDGQRGAGGIAGRDGPTFQLVVGRVVNQVVVDASGQSGGLSGDGQNGGDGGPGAPGHRASLSAFDCKRGPGDGGSGGAGGRGGDGGAGSVGGNGGAVRVLTAEDSLVEAVGKIIARTSGGRGGAGGAGGAGGNGGAGGPRGAAAPPYCRDDARNGDPGPAGAAGNRGVSGSRGAEGLALVRPIGWADISRRVER
ncbi:hypothetical protein ABIF68_010324 [Bradyrhizobium japonicum]